MHITQEFMHEIARNVRRHDLPMNGEITKSVALRYLAPEIFKLRVLGIKLEEIRKRSINRAIPSAGELV